jgi:hypothetical protein
MATSLISDHWFTFWKVHFERKHLGHVGKAYRNRIGEGAWIRRATPVSSGERDRDG